MSDAMTFQQIRETIQEHNVQHESCDRDGREFCDCLARAISQAETTVADALLALEHGWRPELFRSPETQAAAIQILNETRKQLGIEAGDDKKGFYPNWSLLQTTQESLRDHQALVKAAQEQERQFRTTAAAALRELRAQIEEESDKFDSGLESWPYDHCRQMLDATITKLGLEETR